MTKDIEPIEAAVLNVPDLQTLDKDVTAHSTCLSLASVVDPR
ncbi:hypothetical protein AB0N07_43100 [Streptomyces sp. NPDC051172]